jgi:Icc-related predicted phosphoesterase
MKGIFVTDLHGKISRYEKLFSLIKNEKPDVVFMGGDILPHAMKGSPRYDDFLDDYFIPEFLKLKDRMGDRYPEIFLILGNDDPAIEEHKIIEAEEQGILTYINEKKVTLGEFSVYGYCFVPPTPFQLKDWEKYDVSRYVDPGCMHPDEGYRSVEPSKNIVYETIQKDLENLIADEDLSKAVFLFHSPPYDTYLDCAALDGQMIDHVPLDVHVGSIAIKRFIEERQPLLTLHGHIHESTRLTGNWKQQIGKTVAMNGAHDGGQLCAVMLDLENPEDARRLLV